MTLGQRISLHRKRLGISQEGLGERLGVSRQAVSKWETGRAVPDMENFLALARLFGVPVSELTDTPPEKTERPAPEQEAFSETDALPETTEFPDTEIKAFSEADAFPETTECPDTETEAFSETEALPETTECPDTETEAFSVSETAETRKSQPRLWAILGIAGLTVLLLCLGLPLLLLCWNRVEVSDQTAEFQVPVKETEPPEVSIQGPDNEPALPESNNAPNPAEPDATPAPDNTAASDAEIVYRAFNQLAAGDNLTAEERYAFRRDLFANLPSMDWIEFARLGTTEEESDCIFALMNFLLTLEDYSAMEIYRLQRASANPGIDGAYAEFYAGVLSEALSYNPVAFVRCLAYDDSSGVPWPYYALSLASSDLAYFPEETGQVANTLETALSDGNFTEEQSGWCRLLLLYLEETKDGDQSGLPKSPEEMQD